MWTLRSARTADASSIARIIGDWFERTSYVPRLHTPAEDQAFAIGLIEWGGITVADAGEVIGFVAFRSPLLSHLFVDAEWRGQGVGAALLTHVTQSTKRVDLWCFQENITARRFYERHGFSVAETSDGAGNEEKVPDVRYVWEDDQ